jgi:hypothetical protein
MVVNRLYIGWINCEWGWDEEGESAWLPRSLWFVSESSAFYSANAICFLLLSYRCDNWAAQTINPGRTCKSVLILLLPSVFSYYLVSSKFPFSTTWIFCSGQFNLCRRWFCVYIKYGVCVFYCFLIRYVIKFENSDRFNSDRQRTIDSISLYSSVHVCK